MVRRWTVRSAVVASPWMGTTTVCTLAVGSLGLTAASASHLAVDGGVIQAWSLDVTVPTAGPAPTISRAPALAASSSLEAVVGTDADEDQPAQQPDATPDAPVAAEAPVVAELPDVPATDTSAPEVPVDTWVTQGSASLATAPETLTTPKG